MQGAKLSHCPFSGLRRENWLTPSPKCFLNFSSLNSDLPSPMNSKFAGNMPSMNRLKNAGASLRSARSPVPPKTTMTVGSDFRLALGLAWN